MKQRIGGALQQSGVLAAMGLYALDHHVDRLADDHALAARVASHLSDRACVANVLPAETNTVIFDLKIEAPSVPDLEKQLLDDGEVFHDRIADSGWARHDTETAISHYASGDAKRGRRRTGWILCDLCVVMGVQIHKSRHHRKAVRIDGLAHRGCVAAYTGDFTGLDPNISFSWIAAVPVVDIGVLDQ